MFFPRLRRQAKWMFVFLALVFAVGFVVFGVGSSGGGLGDVLGGLGGGSSSSESDLRDKVKQNPNDLQAYQNLASKLQQNGKIDEAIALWQTYTRAHPKNVNALNSLAGLHTQKANTVRNQAARAYQELQSASPGSILPSLQSKGQTVLQPDPINTEAAQAANQRYNEALANLQGAYSAVVKAYAQLAAADPKNPTYQSQLGDAAVAAVQTGSAAEIPTAIKAYKKLLKLAPDFVNSKTIKERIRILESAQKSATSG
jgi:tetratricopeptide (TPR) repeat protein